MIDDYFNYFENISVTLLNKEENNNVAVIVEPRKHKYLIGVIKNMMTSLKGWNLHIFGSDNNEEYIKENINGNYKFTNLQILDLNQTSYSLLLQNLCFWEQIKEENIIIFQVDSFINNNNYSIPLDYGFIGAIYQYGYQENNKLIELLSPVNASYNMNGGFSFRLRTVMIQCIKNVSINDIIQYRIKNNYNIYNFLNKYILPEDVFFCNAISLLKYPIPSEEICNNFCSQQNKNYNSFGVHGFDKDYCNFNEKDIKSYFSLKK